jgi:RNA polymerase sigma factor (sigma-70 family)
MDIIQNTDIISKQSTLHYSRIRNRGDVHLLDNTLKCKRFDEISDRNYVSDIIANVTDAAFCLFHHKLKDFFEYLSRKFSKLRLSGSDIAQELYIFLSEGNWKKLRTFEFKCTLLGWIKIVTNNYLINKIKKTSPWILDVIFFTDIIRYREEDEYNPLEDIPDHYQLLLEEMLDNEDKRKKLHEAIDSLDGYPKEVLRLRCFVGLSSKETADILCRQGKNVTPNAVDQVLRRAKETIRKILDMRD